MHICRHYLMTAQSGKEDLLREALNDLANKIKPMAGCRGIEIYNDVEDGTRFHFLEHWIDREAHKAAGSALGKEVFAPVMAALAVQPEGTYLYSVSG